MNALIRGTAALCFLFMSAGGAVARAELWVAAPGAVYRIETVTGAAARLPVEPGGIRDMALDARRGRVWLVRDSGQIEARSLDGAAVLSRNLPRKRGLGGAPPVGIEVEHATGRVFASRGSGIYVLSPDGKMHSVAELPEPVRRLAVDPDRHTLWVATGRALHAFDIGGESLGSVRIDGRFRIVDLSVNRSGGNVLLVLKEAGRTAKVLREYDRSGALKRERRLRDLVHVEADESGGFWATGIRNVLRFDPRGRLACSLALRRTRPTPLATAGPNGRGLWVATETRLVRLSDACAVERQLAKAGIPVVAMQVGVAPD